MWQNNWDTKFTRMLIYLLCYSYTSIQLLFCPCQEGVSSHDLWQAHLPAHIYTSNITQYFLNCPSHRQEGLIPDTKISWSLWVLRLCTVCWQSCVGTIYGRFFSVFNPGLSENPGLIFGLCEYYHYRLSWAKWLLYLLIMWCATLFWTLIQNVVLNFKFIL